MKRCHTRYQHNAQGQLSAISLPSGHWLRHTRNGQGQVVGTTPIIGTVNMEAYAQWLKDNYNLTIATGN